MRVRLVAAFSSLLLALSAPAAVETSSPSTVVQSFFGSWAAGDVDAAAAYWTGLPSPEFHRHVRRVPVATCLILHEARIGDVRLLSDDRAEASVELRLTKRNAMPGAPVRHELTGALLRLRRVDSVWRIESWREREEVVVDELLAIGSAAERSDWLDARAHEWTPALTRALTSRAMTMINRDDLPLAGELIALATRVATAIDDDASMALALAAASAFERKKLPPDHAASVALGREAAALAERSGDPDAIAAAYVRLGRALNTHPNVDGEALERALALADFVEDQNIPAQAATHLAAYHEYHKDLRLSLLHATIAERFGRATGQESAILSAELNLAGVYDRTGDLELAALHYDRAAAIARRNGFNRIYASFVNLIVSARFRLGTPPAELIPVIDEALSLPFVDRTSDIVHDLLITRSIMHRELRNFDEAEADILDALALRDGATYLSLAELRFVEGRYEEAKAAVEMSGLPRAGHWTAIAILRELGDIDQALADARCNSDWQDAMLSRMLLGDRARRTFLAARYDLDRLVVDMLVRRGDYREALVAADETKGRVLLEAAARARVQAHERMPESQTERELKAKVERLNIALLAEKDTTRHDALRADLTRARLELDDVRTRRGLRTPEERYTTVPAARLQEWPFTGLVALEYVVGEHDTIIFVVREGAPGRARVDVRVVRVGRGELTRMVTQLRERIAVRDLRYSEPARRLYDLLVAPVEPLIASAETLCIIPDAELWKVPFQVLMTRRGTALVERVPLFYAPSIRMLHAIGSDDEPRRPPRLLALGNPSIGATTAARFRAYERATSLGDLSDAEDEVQRIARLYGRDRSAVHVRGDAREALFKEKAHEFDVLHVASHGLVDDSAPMFSALVLAGGNGDQEDGLLEAHEVAELRLNADLVVLSACETAAGKIGGGEGILGLSWAFLAAGTRGLVGSQWKAPSAATEMLMVAFHERLLAGDSPAEALRRAQLRLRRDERYEAPLDWAPFIVVGHGLQ